MTKRIPQTKLVLAWVDLDGFELTGKYRDRLCQLRETRAIPQAKACMWGSNLADNMPRLLAHIAKERNDHLWMGWFALPDTNNILTKARALALAEYQKGIANHPAK
jgi:hypothetical protein